jgi:hypothetical protein
MTILIAPRPTAAPVPDAEALFWEARLRRRRRRRWTAGILLVVLALGAAVATDDHPAGRSSTPAARSSRRVDVLPVGTPKEIVGWTSGFRLVTISTRTGVVLHTLATQVGIFAPGLPDVSVAPDGTVFFDSSAASTFDRGDWTGDQIFSVPINGGPITRVAAGVDPEVSPDGRRLAYVDSDPQGEAPISRQLAASPSPMWSKAV